jgi:hypothetical protein
MDWDAIGAIAEMVAAVAVVVSLIYIAVQVKGNSELLERTIQSNRTQNTQAVIHNFDSWRKMILETGSADLWFRGINDLGGLDQTEKINFSLIASTLIWSCWSFFQLQKNEGLIADLNEHLWQDLFKHPGYREWLLVHRRYHSDDFGEFLDRVCEVVGDDRYEPGQSSSLIDGQH